MDEAMRICRLCYVMAEKGARKAELDLYREKLFREQGRTNTKTKSQDGHDDEGEEESEDEGVENAKTRATTNITTYCVRLCYCFS